MAHAVFSPGPRIFTVCNKLEGVESDAALQASASDCSLELNLIRISGTFLIGVVSKHLSNATDYSQNGYQKQFRFNRTRFLPESNWPSHDTKVCTRLSLTQV